MDELIKFLKMSEILPVGVSAAEAQAEKQSTLSITISGGQTAGTSASELTEIFVRTSGERTGLAYTQCLDESTEDLMRKAFENSRHAESAGPEPMNGPEDIDNQPQEQECRHTDMAEIRSLAHTLEDAIKSAAGDVSFSQVQISETVRTMGLINTLGCNRTRSRRTLEAHVMLVSDQNGHVIYDEIMSAPDLAGITADYFVKRLERFRDMKRSATSFSGGIYRAVLDASVMCNILNTAWQMFSAPYYLTNNTPLAGHLGQHVFAEAVSITDLPTLNQSGYQFALDCEGSPAAAEKLVERGVLNGLLQTLASARAMVVPPTGNAGRKTLLSGTVHTQVAAMPKNFCLMPGEASLADLIAELQDGIYICESYDVFHSINVASGAFNIPCKGIVVKNGDMKGLVDGLTINGQLCDLLAHVESVANDLIVQPMVMLKSYTVASPSLLVSRLRVVGQVD